MTPAKLLTWDVKDSAVQVAQATVQFILHSATTAIADHGCFRLVLAGGSTPRKAYEQLAQQTTDWSKWQFFYGDERCLPTDDAERNSTMVQQVWLDKISIRDDQHFPIPAELGAAAGAEKYLQTIGDIESFDLVLLGMGEDGHTASLFPNQPWQQDEKILAVNDAPKPPPQRISMGPALIHAARYRCFIITGAGKAAAVKQWRENADLPITRAACPGDTVIIDKPAWGADD